MLFRKVQLLKIPPPPKKTNVHFSLFPKPNDLCSNLMILFSVLDSAQLVLLKLKSKDLIKSSVKSTTMAIMKETKEGGKKNNVQPYTGPTRRATKTGFLSIVRPRRQCYSMPPHVHVRF